MIDKHPGYHWAMFIAALATIVLAAFFLFDRFWPSVGGRADANSEQLEIKEMPIQVTKPPKIAIGESPAVDTSIKEKSSVVEDASKSHGLNADSNKVGHTAPSDVLKPDFGEPRVSSVTEPIAKIESQCPQSREAYDDWLEVKRLCGLNDDDACRDIVTKRIRYENLMRQCPE